MNEGFTPHRPPDEEPDPLLAALRQRLGAGYGQEPSPELWAGIQQRLPAAAPRPWWLRARRLLPLLAGLLLVSLVLVRQVARSPLANHTARSASANQPQPTASANRLRSTASSQLTLATPTQPSTEAPAPTATSPGAPAGRVAAPGAAAPAGIASPSRMAHNRATNAPGVAASSDGQRLRHDSRPAANQSRAVARIISSSPTTVTSLASPLPPSAHGQLATRQPGRESLVMHNSPSLAAGRLAGRVNSRAIASSPRHSAFVSSTGLSLVTARSTGRRAARHSVSGLSLAHAATASSHLRLLASPAEEHVAGASWRRKGRTRLNEASSTPGLEEQAAGDELLALHQAGLLLPVSRLPAPLTARPDSFAPHLAPVRRWALLLVAGPTLSYRTLPASTLSYSSLPLTTAASASAGTRTSPDFTDLERPAAGLGAQVQVRRVLAGRWALALGLGYQEYATRLNLQVRTRQGYTTSSTTYQVLDTTTIVVNQRDTYRFLTLPVQLSYALGPPRGRLALGLLAGAEPSWYLGGRTTENSSCSCQQQSFSSASGSPYNLLSLALSLGLDARYRLGGPASRWQVVLQPTGRYLASAFVRSASLGYVRRQPYSFGLLTGFSWDFR